MSTDCKLLKFSINIHALWKMCIVCYDQIMLVRSLKCEWQMTSYQFQWQFRIYDAHWLFYSIRKISLPFWRTSNSRNSSMILILLQGRLVVEVEWQFQLLVPFDCWIWNLRERRGRWRPLPRLSEHWGLYFVLED